ncbi:MAG: nuclear transport factor 2 family protein [Chthoniobacterales bacterium]
MKRRWEFKARVTSQRLWLTRFSAKLLSVAQQKETTDSRTVQQRDLLGDVKALDEFSELSQKLDEAYNKNDAAAVAALFTEDGLLVASDGMFSGWQDIEKRYEDTFQRWPITDFNSRRERRHLSAIDNAVWSAGQWASTFRSETGPIFAWGYWSTIYVREGDAWKMRVLSLIEHQRLATPAETK